MNKIQKGSTQHLVAQTIAIIVAGIIIFPVTDFIISKIFQTEFAYNVDDHIIEPIFYGIVIGIVLWVIDKKAVKTSKK